jgi:hypothetical protein
LVATDPATERERERERTCFFLAGKGRRMTEEADCREGRRSDVTHRRQISELGGLGSVGSAGRRKRRTTHDGEISDLYGERFQREREVFVRNEKFETPTFFGLRFSSSMTKREKNNILLLPHWRVVEKL